MMGDVYNGSYLNIAAINSPDAKGGCFLDGMKRCVKVSTEFQYRISPVASSPSSTSSKFASWTWLSAGQRFTGFGIGGAEKPNIPCVRALHMDAQWTVKELVSEL
jgi:hypothetical protein